MLMSQFETIKQVLIRQCFAIRSRNLRPQISSYLFRTWSKLMLIRELDLRLRIASGDQLRYLLRVVTPRRSLFSVSAT